MPSQNPWPRPKGHDTEFLFAKLDESDKAVIEENLLALVRQHQDYPLMSSKGVLFDAKSVAKRAKSFFARGRYWSELDLPDADEQGFVTNAGIMALTGAVHKLIIKLKPDWPERTMNFRLRMPGEGVLPT